MADARTVLDAIRQRADQATEKWPGLVRPTRASAEDVPRLVAALTAVLNLADEMVEAGRYFYAVELRERIEAALTEEENG